MDDLLKKLNALVKATINEMLSSNPVTGTHATRDLVHLTGDESEKQIKTLRQRINETLDFEGKIQQRVQALQAQVDRWNQSADEALTSGDELSARYAIDQMNRAQQALTVAQSDLHEHQKVTEELIVHVNTLEAAVESSRRAQKEAAPPPSQLALGSIRQTISNSLQEIRDKIDQIGDQINSRSDVSEGDGDQISKDQRVDDDLERRRQRLSKSK